jgi:biopolymer transport protein ExbD
MKKKYRPAKKSKFDNLEMNMTPMIDVVFQLMIFFLVTLKKEDIIARLDVNRPMAPPIKSEVQPPELLTVLVYKDGFVLQGRRVDLKELDRQLSKIASYDRTASVIIKCTADSPHSYLIQLLNLCSKSRLSNISVFSM